MQRLSPQQDPFSEPAQQAPFHSGSPGPRGIEELPYAVAVLVFGILSILVAFFYGIFGIVFAVVPLALSSSSMKLYRTDPSHFSHSSYGYLKAGRICAVVGLVFSAMVILGMVLLYGFFIALFL